VLPGLSISKLDYSF